MKIDRDQIIKVAGLARLELSDHEIGEYTGQLSDIISYVEKINELSLDGVKPTDHIADLKNVVRDDRVGESTPAGDIKKFAPQFENGFFMVPRIIED